jgi:hypothetical protein
MSLPNVSGFLPSHTALHPKTQYSLRRTSFSEMSELRSKPQSNLFFWREKKIKYENELKRRMRNKNID